jgi:triacylglycerol lipase
MGVTLGRQVIKGGKVDSTLFPFDLGPSLADKVDTFIGICGANYGLVTCQYVGSMLPTCNSMNGFYPGTAKDVGLSSYLKNLNDNKTKEGEHVYALYSTQDDLIMYGDLVFG